MDTLGSRTAWKTVRLPDGPDGTSSAGPLKETRCVNTHANDDTKKSTPVVIVDLPATVEHAVDLPDAPANSDEPVLLGPGFADSIILGW